MKNAYRPSIFILAFILLSYSCTEREGIANEGNFLLDASEVQNLTNNQFLMVTDPTDGEVLYWETGLTFGDDINFEVETETVDITTGVEYNTGFDIRTYRDVKSGFRLSGFTFQCYDGQLDFDLLGLTNVELVITGTTEILELYNPLYRQNDLSELDTTNIEIKNSVIYDYANDVTIIKGIFNNTFKDIQLAMRFSGEAELKSLIIKKDDWVKVDDENHKFEIQQDDFSSCTVHEIELGKEAGWIIDAEALTSSGARVTLASWSNQAHTQNGDRIMVVVDDRIELQDFWLSIRSNYTLEGNQFQRSFTSIPTTIPMEELETEIILSTSSSYTLTVPLAANLVSARYQYKNNNRIFHWTIHQSASSNSSYNLPEIQAEYLDETNLMKQVLSSPEHFIVETYDLDEDLEKIYHQTNIDRQLKCLDYNSSYKSLEF